MRLATGSSTVAMATAEILWLRLRCTAWAFIRNCCDCHRSRLADFSHVNDGGFWLVKEYFNMTVVQTMKTWSVSETIVSVTALGFTAIAWHFA